jgi:hypothetical protein
VSDKAWRENLLGFQNVAFRNDFPVLRDLFKYG